MAHVFKDLRTGGSCITTGKIHETHETPPCSIIFPSKPPLKHWDFHGFAQVTPGYPVPSHAKPISGSSSGLAMEMDVQGIQGHEVLVGLGHLGPGKLGHEKSWFFVGSPIISHMKCGLSSYPWFIHIVHVMYKSVNSLLVWLPKIRGMVLIFFC